MKKLTITGVAALVLVSCSSLASGMTDCKSQVRGRDACNVAQHNGHNSAAEKQALVNAQSLPPQKAQAAKKESTFTKHYDGMAIKRDKLGILTVDGKPAAKDEVTANATTYSQGLYTIIVYKNGKVAVMKDNSFQGYAK